MNRLLGFAVGLVITLIGAALMVLLILQPEAKDVPEYAVLFGTPLVIAIVAAGIAHRYAWWRKFNRLALALFIVYAIGAGLILFSLYITTRLMFLSTHDATLATVIVIYATGVTLVFGMFVVTSLTDSIGKLILAARAVQRGDLSVRADEGGKDEIAALARTFNEMTAQLASVREKEAQLDAARRDWIAWVSHDLRTPLTSLRARAEALADDVVSQPDEVKAYLTGMRNDTSALSSLIDDLSELARIDAGGLKLDKLPLPVADLVSDCIESLSIIARDKDVTLRGSVAPEAGLVNVSPTHIQRVLNNLVGNAIAHTKAGGDVAVEAKRVVSGMGSGMPAQRPRGPNGLGTFEGGVMQITISDTGDGIAPQDLPHVFERFYRGEPARTRLANGKSAGMGLGLVIARELVEAHGGQIGITSTLGKGTTVWVRLPGRVSGRIRGSQSQ